MNARSTATPANSWTVSLAPSPPPAGRGATSPLMKIIGKCNGCGTVTQVTLRACYWPDGKLTAERHCDRCKQKWTPLFESIGCKLEEVDDEKAAPGVDLRTPL